MTQNDTFAKQAGGLSELEIAAVQCRAWHLFCLSPLLLTGPGWPHEILAGGEMMTILKSTGGARGSSGQNPSP